MPKLCTPYQQPLQPASQPPSSSHLPALCLEVLLGHGAHRRKGVWHEVHHCPPNLLAVHLRGAARTMKETKESVSQVRVGAA